ncbi:Coiled-coil domain-containing protein 189 [Phytophthora citrophthora]|uniref:Coiled-coil domain-containing protein 189 n=1 Tax=Phytophthora citrophthora TaxID=4793 RepID=A0AAD9G179_9STRA|nr:Coiled-coil domain-containing protein 189 [Phytophthora citrophthora]
MSQTWEVNDILDFKDWPTRPRRMPYDDWLPKSHSSEWLHRRQLWRSDKTEAIVWKHASERELSQLATRHSVDDCKSTLAEIFGLDLADEKQGFLLDFHLHNYSYPLLLNHFTFCRQRHFQLNQTSVFLGICQTLMKRDFEHDSTTNLKTSFEFFQSILLTHSVNRSPKSVGIFSREEIAAIVDYVTNSYYRHFQLYKCIYTPYYHVHFVQREINDIQIPKTPRPLAQGFLQRAKTSSAGEKEEDTPIEALAEEASDPPPDE